MPRSKLLKAAVTYLFEYWGCDKFSADFGKKIKRFDFPTPAPLGEKKYVPHLTCFHIDSGTKVILEVADTTEYIDTGETSDRWRTLFDYCREKEVKLLLLTYKHFGSEEGREIVRNRLRESMPRVSTAPIDILVFHRGKVRGEIDFSRVL